MSEEIKTEGQTKVEDVVIPAVIETDEVTKLGEEITKLTEERDNYKAVALKRLGKLPGDADFLGDSELSVAEQVRLALLDREIEANKKAEKIATDKLIRENNELKLALKNRPGGSLGSEGGAVAEVKDNVFSPEQIEALKKKAISLKADPEKFIERAKQNLLNRK